MVANMSVTKFPELFNAVIASKDFDAATNIRRRFGITHVGFGRVQQNKLHCKQSNVIGYYFYWNQQIILDALSNSTVAQR